jgi:hypothetical protein
MLKTGLKLSFVQLVLRLTILSAIREEFINKNIFEERTNSIEERINFSRLPCRNHEKI